VITTVYAELSKSGVQQLSLLHSIKVVGMAYASAMPPEQCRGWMTTITS